MFTKNPYFFAFFPFALADAVLTILGQPQTYWRYGIVNEASPAYYVLQFSPYAFIAAVVVWLIIWYIIFLKLSRGIALYLSLFFIAAHAWGSTSWVFVLLRDAGFYNPSNQTTVIQAWFVAMAYLAVLSAVSAYFLKKASLSE